MTQEKLNIARWATQPTQDQAQKTADAAFCMGIIKTRADAFVEPSKGGFNIFVISEWKR
jgi:hypothetical protein